MKCFCLSLFFSVYILPAHKKPNAQHQELVQAQHLNYVYLFSHKRSKTP